MPVKRLPPVLDKSNTEVDGWEERDRLNINLRRLDTDRIVFTRWDDDAREMFEDEFLDRRDLHGSILKYLYSMGKARPRGNPKRKNMAEDADEVFDEVIVHINWKFFGSWKNRERYTLRRIASAVKREQPSRTAGLKPVYYYKAINFQ